jgi:uncharacterized protein YndB with AHSA1/START domain
MKRRDVNVTATTSAAPEVVYGLLADGSTWPAWSVIESVELEREGDPPPEGVGAIRVNKRGRTTGRDEILELVPNRRLKYATLSGLPFRDYVGEVDLTPTTEGGTTIHWHSSFFPKTPGTGWIMERGIRRFLGQCVAGLAEYAATANATSRNGSQG